MHHPKSALLSNDLGNHTPRNTDEYGRFTDTTKGVKLGRHKQLSSEPEAAFTVVQMSLGPLAPVKSFTPPAPPSFSHPAGLASLPFLQLPAPFWKRKQQTLPAAIAHLPQAYSSLKIILVPAIMKIISFHFVTYYDEMYRKLKVLYKYDSSLSLWTADRRCLHMLSVSHFLCAGQMSAEGNGQVQGQTTDLGPGLQPWPQPM